MAKKISPTFYMELGEAKISDKEIVAKVKEAWVSEGNLVKDIDTLEIYPKVDENKAYYVINETVTGDIDLF